VAYGYLNSTSVKQAYLYDVATNKWSATNGVPSYALDNDLSATRLKGTTTLPEGALFVGRTGSAEFYHASTGLFDHAAARPTTCYGANIVLNNGDVLSPACDLSSALYTRKPKS